MSTLFEKAVCFSVSLSRLGTSRKLADSQFEASGADKQYIRATKLLLKSPELDAITRRDNEFRAYLRRVAVSTPFLRDGSFMIPNDSVEAVDAATTVFLAERAVLVRTLMSAYPRLVEADRARLGEAVFNPLDYLDEADVADAFSVRTQYVAFEVPERLKAINRAVWEKARAANEAMWVEAQAEVQQALRVGFAELVSHAIERLTGEKGDGKPKVFRDSLIKNIEEFLTTFEQRNLTDDAELATLVGKARAMLAGVDPAMLRADVSVRQRVADGFTELQANLDTMLVDRPSRYVELPD